MSKTLKEILEEFFKSNQDIFSLSTDIFIFRGDGIIAFRKESSGNSHGESVGPLMIGAWQAMKQLSDQAKLGVKKDNIRLNFENSDTAVVITPLEFKGGELFMGCIYKNVLNPGKLRNSLKIIGIKLERYLEEKFIVEKTSESYLFKDITDDEIDKLFDFVSV